MAKNIRQIVLISSSIFFACLTFYAKSQTERFAGFNIFSLQGIDNTVKSCHSTIYHKKSTDWPDKIKVKTQRWGKRNILLHSYQNDTSIYLTNSRTHANGIDYDTICCVRNRSFTVYRCTRLKSYSETIAFQTIIQFTKVDSSTIDLSFYSLYSMYITNIASDGFRYPKLAKSYSSKYLKENLESKSPDLFNAVLRYRLKMDGDKIESCEITNFSLPCIIENKFFDMPEFISGNLSGKSFYQRVVLGVLLNHM